MEGSAQRCKSLEAELQRALISLKQDLANVKPSAESDHATFVDFPLNEHVHASARAETLAAITKVAEAQPLRYLYDTLQVAREVYHAPEITPATTPAVVREVCFSLFVCLSLHIV